MNLVCPECHRENESERIYCHDCGARLNRSALTKEAAKKEDPKETQRRVVALFDRSQQKMRQRFFGGSKLVLGALFLAVFVQMLRSPDVAEARKNSVLPTPIGLDLENAAMDPRAAPLSYSDEQVNAYLAYALKGKQSALSKYLQFERIIVDFEEGYVHFSIERSLFGYPLFTSASYAASLQGGNVIATGRGWSIGRLPIHPSLLPFGSLLFSDVRAALERERKSLVKLNAIELHPHLIVLTPKAP